VTATTPGATQFFNPIRSGSVASDERVWDRMTGQPLKFDEVGQAIARAGGVWRRARWNHRCSGRQDAEVHPRSARAAGTRGW
jgi:hypothetical protein